MIDHPSEPGVQRTLAANLRRLRVARRLSLSELARATGMSKATLSGIESGRANPTVDTLATLAAGLRTSVGELVEEPPLAEIRILRAARSEAARPDGVARRLLETISLGGELEVVQLTLPARRLHELEARESGAREHVLVLQGKLIAGPVERPTELAPGDYASFPADLPHAYEAGRNPARALVLLHRPG